jgi:L-glyceraldehyde 3-phosphate reductase
MLYQADEKRYEAMKYNQTGLSGLKLPAISLGLWQNFGGTDTYENGRAMIRKAFDLGITHLDLANVYGPPFGSAEEMFGSILKKDLAPYRDELIISTKASGQMFGGPYGGGGSKKTFVAALDKSLKRMGLDYVDIYYSHGYDPETPLEETMGALDQIVRQGKALYVGISNHNAEKTAEAIKILKGLGTPLLIHQHDYSMFSRWSENGLHDVLKENGVGSIAFGPLQQGLLTTRYISGIPSGSRATSKHAYPLGPHITEEYLQKVNRLNAIAQERGQSLAQMALAWVLRRGTVTSALIGASKVSQIEENAAAINNLDFSDEELKTLDEIM